MSDKNNVSKSLLWSDEIEYLSRKVEMLDRENQDLKLQVQRLTQVSVSLSSKLKNVMTTVHKHLVCETSLDGTLESLEAKEQILLEVFNSTGWYVSDIHIYNHMTVDDLAAKIRPKFEV